MGKFRVAAILFDARSSNINGGMSIISNAKVYSCDDKVIFSSHFITKDLPYYMDRGL